MSAMLPRLDEMLTATAPRPISGSSARVTRSIPTPCTCSWYSRSPIDAVTTEPSLAPIPALFTSRSTRSRCAADHCPKASTEASEVTSTSAASTSGSRDARSSNAPAVEESR